MICQNNVYIYWRGIKFGRIATGWVRTLSKIACQEIALGRLGHVRDSQVRNDRIYIQRPPLPTEIIQTYIQIMAWIINYNHIKQMDVISHSRCNLNYS